jgi:hypothetical protein
LRIGTIIYETKPTKYNHLNLKSFQTQILPYTIQLLTYQTWAPPVIRRRREIFHAAAAVKF